ncbi:uncharacterized protein LOC114865755 [Betta splendens]|uniref:Uncharacterized protein LOC114865755 n=1 Tax=Betta splendens TaxID=158456 RepID=A0A6P7NYI7_BETSP|nr:uncharacterized protein LOC114865755 [Betta splendens]
MGLVFNSSSTTGDLPSNAVVAQTLVDAANNTTNNFSVSINPSTVTVLSSPVSTPFTPANATLTTVASTTSTTLPTASTTTTTTAATTVGISIIPVTFKSRLDTFTSDLNNPLSARFIQRTATITSQLKPLFKNDFPSLINMTIVKYRNGSIDNFFDLSFSSTSVPNNTQIANVLINASSFVTGFDIDVSSIIVNNIPSGGVAHKISLVTASCLVLLSLLLSSHQ